MTELKPYLKFADAATQTWINEYSIAVLLISVKLFSFTTSVLTQLETLSQHAVDTAVDVAVNASEAVISVANETVHAATTDLNEGLNGLSEVVNDVLEVFEKVESKIESIFSSSDEESTNTTLQNKIKKINLTISSLNNFYIDSDINNKLEKLANEVPTFDELKNDTKNWLEKPFYYVADELKNQDFASLTTPLNNSISLKSCQVVISNSSSSTTSSSLNKSETCNDKKNGIDTLKVKLQLLFQGITKSFSDWQSNTNEYIAAVETRGNNEVVIKKIEYISSEINSTATKIYNSLSSTINDTFFGTIFEKPLTSVMNCIIGNKLKSISEGASWVKKEFQIELPRISSNDTEEIYSALTETDTNNSTINYTTSYLNYTTTTNNSNNNSTNYVADKTLNKVITEISSIKKDIKEDINKIFDYYMSTIKYEFSIVMILFILWCCQFVIAYLLLKLRYKVI
ncbi:hypothetical protein ACO0SA_002587 [Hanseniaspora valbyensis]